MKKVMGGLLMTSTLLLGAVMPMVAHAAENRTGTTNTTAEFTANTDVVNPVDPTDPTTPLDPDDGNNGAGSGSGLSLIYAPGLIGFGSNVIDTVNAQSYDATDGDGTKGTTTMGTTQELGLQVSDQRGTSKGWTLSVTAAGGNMTTLKGATIKLPLGTVSSSGDTGTNGATAQAVELSVSGQASTAANGQLVGAASGTVLSAADGTGSGITSSLMNTDNVRLGVPANAASVGTYSGTLNWNLSDTPAS